MKQKQREFRVTLASMLDVYATGAMRYVHVNTWCKRTRRSKVQYWAHYAPRWR